MPAIHDERYQCHCLTSHLSHGLRVHKDIFTFDMEDVLRTLFALWPDRRFLGIPFAQFSRDYYLVASNMVAAHKLRARGMSDDEIVEALASRKCGGCGFHAYRLLRDSPEQVHMYLLEAA